jgi:hypothetical protein
VGAGNVLAIATTVTNTTGSAMDIQFQRDIDWDVFPTEFDENTFAPSIAGAPMVIDSSFDGFENPAPSTPYFASCAGGCNQTSDLGGGIKLDLGTVGAGDSVSFVYLYGISQSGENVNGLLADAAAAGSYYTVATQSSENGPYGTGLGANSAFIGIAGATSAVPEPSTWPLAMVALGGLALKLRRRKV